ncbi:uncharacterized protein [Emydura macquarii macquarii]|uniref:uncharacterized protein isoform X3 n=1 Tax=Emydura macquarii macquarii TaxID=1129001 RepID=UPI00352B6A15
MSPSVEVFKLCRMLPGGMEEHSRAPQCPKSPAPRGRPPQTRPCWRRCPFCSLSSRLRRIPGPSKRRRKMLKLVAWLSALCPMALKTSDPLLEPALGLSDIQWQRVPQADCAHEPLFRGRDSDLPVAGTTGSIPRIKGTQNFHSDSNSKCWHDIGYK